jgi:zinc protease
VSENSLRSGPLAGGGGVVARGQDGRRRLVSLVAAAAGFTLSLMLTAGSAAHAADDVKLEKNKMDIKQVTSPGGIKAWLVEEHSVPLVAIRFAFEGGTAQDPDGKPGLANFLTAMLDEGAGDLKAEAFQERMEDLAMRMSFSEGRDTFYGSFQTLSDNRDETIELLRLALTEPRFDETALERIRKQLIAGLAFAAKNPNRVAGRLWAETAFQGHPYGRPANGTPESVNAITADDLRAYTKNVFARDNLHVAVVGDITSEELGRVLDRVFGALPQSPDLKEIPEAKIAGGTLKVNQMPVPQSVAVFGLPGLKRDDPDFIPAYVMNHILGGGGFSSRLMEEVREKRGLAYSVYSYLQSFDRAAIFAGQVATKNEALTKSLDVIRGEITQIAEKGVTQEDLDNAKSYLTGSYALRFDTSSKIASQLLAIQLEGLGIDYVNRRNELINAVTLDDVKRVARRLMKPERLIVAIAGQPEGIAAAHP